MIQKKVMKYVVLCTVFLFLIVGCGKGGDIGGLQSNPFLGGTRGVEIEFLEENPPQEVTDGDTFDFQAIVKLINEGEEDVPKNDITVSLIGFDPVEFGFPNLDEKFLDDNLIARKRIGNDIIEPIETLVTFPTDSDSFIYEKSLIGNSKRFTFRADVCYKYKTKALSEICVLENLINPDKDDICVPVETKDIFSSSSPMQVKSFSQSSAGNNKIRFSFDIVHSGNGDVFVPDGKATCPKTAKEVRSDENIIQVVVETFISNNLNCVGITGGTGSSGKVEGKVRLVDGTRTITCTQDLPPTNERGFEKEVSIELKFKYHEFIDAYGSNGILVRHIENGGSSTTTTTQDV